MSAKITLTLNDAGRSPFAVDAEKLVRYDTAPDGTIVTCMMPDGLTTRLVRESRAEIEALVRAAMRLP
jgi:hypothetical protein